MLGGGLVSEIDICTLLRVACRGAVGTNSYAASLLYLLVLFCFFRTSESSVVVVHFTLSVSLPSYLRHLLVALLLCCCNRCWCYCVAAAAVGEVAVGGLAEGCGGGVVGSGGVLWSSGGMLLLLPAKNIVWILALSFKLWTHCYCTCEVLRGGA